jgi:phage-related protein
MAGSTSVILVRVLGNTKGLSRSLQKAQNSLGGLERISGSITGAMKVATITTVAFGAAAVAAGAIGAAALAAVPAAILGLGILVAAQNARVKSAYSDMADHVMKVMERITKPLVGPLVRGAGQLRQAFDAITPSLRRMFAAGAPLINEFFRALPPLAAKIGPVLERAFAAGLPVLRAFGQGMTQLVAGFGGMLDELGQGSAKFAEFIRALFAGVSQLLPALGRLLTALTPIGTAIVQTLLPALASMLDWISARVGPAVQRVTEFFREHATIAKGVGIALIGLVVVVKTLNVVMGLASSLALVFKGVAAAVRVAIIVWKNAQLALNLAMMMNPIGLVIAAIVALVAIFVVAYKKSETFRRVVDAAWSAIKRATSAVWEFLKRLTLDTWNAIKSTATRAVDAVKSGVTSAWNAIKSATSSVWNGVKSVVGSVTAFIVGLFMNFSVPGLIIKHWSTVRSATTSAWNGIKSAVATAVSGVVSTVMSIKSKVTGAFAGAAGWLLSAGRNIIQGLLDGIGGMIGAVQSKLGELTSMIPNWKGPAAKDRKLLRPVGKMIMNGLIKGFEDGRDGVRSVLEKVTDLITRTMDTRFKSDKLAKAASTEAIKALADESKAMLANARVRETVAGKLDAARDRLKDALQQSRDYAAAVKESVLAFGAITGFQDADTGLVTAQGIVEGLREKVASAQQYAKLLRRLTKMGINKTTLDQLAQAGVEGGLATAQALAKGGKEAVTEVNKLTRDLTATGTQLGKNVAKTLHGAGIEAAQGLVAGLKSQAQALRAVARQLGQDLAAELRAQLDIAPPNARPRLSDAAATGKGGTAAIVSEIKSLRDDTQGLRRTIDKLPSKYRLNERTA